MKNFKFKDNLGKDINVYKWVPKKDIDVKGVVQIAHGMTETALRYSYFAEKLNSHGYIVYAHDHRGHGKSAKNIDELGYVGENDGFMLMLNNMKQLNDIIRKENKNKEIILFGHSMGSFLSQRYAQLYSNTIDRLILSGTNGKPKGITKLGAKIAKIEMILKGRKSKSKLMDKLSFGNFNNNFKPIRTSYDWLCSVEDEVDKYIDDEYCGFICTTSFYYDLINGLWSIHNNNNFELIDKNLPVYIFAGDKDPVGDFGEGIKDLYKRYYDLGLKDVSYKLYKDGRHEMLNEYNKDEVIQDIIEWIEK